MSTTNHDTKTIGGARRTNPTIPADDPRFVWTAGANVQATWRRFGWAPPSELKGNGGNSKES
jgi:hypothetical protein